MGGGVGSCQATKSPQPSTVARVVVPVQPCSMTSGAFRTWETTTKSVVRVPWTRTSAASLARDGKDDRDMTVTEPSSKTMIQVPHFVRGQLVWGNETEYLSRDFGVPFVTPHLRLDELFPPRSEPGPAFDVPLSEIIDLLVETGKRLRLESNEYL